MATDIILYFLFMEPYFPPVLPIIPEHKINQLNPRMYEVQWINGPKDIVYINTSNIVSEEFYQEHKQVAKFFNMKTASMYKEYGGDQALAWLAVARDTIT